MSKWITAVAACVIAVSLLRKPRTAEKATYAITVMHPQPEGNERDFDRFYLKPEDITSIRV